MAAVKPALKSGLKQRPNSKSSGSAKPKSKSRVSKAKPEVKTKRTSSAASNKKKKKNYTAEELGVPMLNGIIPVGVQKPKGKKKGKVFVDDAESMMAIMGMVQAEKEGEREGKIMKARQLEEIREAKHLETEKRAQAKKDKLEAVKDEIRVDRRRKTKTYTRQDLDSKADKLKKRTKRVSFG